MLWFYEYLLKYVVQYKLVIPPPGLWVSRKVESCVGVTVISRYVSETRVREICIRVAVVSVAHVTVRPDTGRMS